MNISGMSFGSLSGNADRGDQPRRRAGRLPAQHRRGRVSPYHRNGGDLVFQIGTAYFGCRDEQGRFDLPRLKELVAGAPIRALEIKLSQGAKPGLGGVLPAPKVSQEIAETRGVPRGATASARRGTRSSTTSTRCSTSSSCWPRRPGCRSASSPRSGTWGSGTSSPTRWRTTDRGVDFVSIDGGEGGTGASPLIFTDAVSLPFRLGFARVYASSPERGLHEQVTFIGAGKLGLPDNAVVAFALGADMVNVAREAMLAVGCVQAQKCHTGECPTGVATQNPWLATVSTRARRPSAWPTTSRPCAATCSRSSETCGVEHPGLIGPDYVEILTGQRAAPRSRGLRLRPGWGFPSVGDQQEIIRLMTGTARQGGSAPPSPTAVS